MLDLVKVLFSFLSKMSAADSQPCMKKGLQLRFQVEFKVFVVFNDTYQLTGPPKRLCYFNSGYWIGHAHSCNSKIIMIKGLFQTQC